MPIAMEGDHLLPAGRDTVWRLLNDPEVLRACVPGCEELTQTSPTSYDAVARIKIGPVKARFRGKVRLEDIDAPAGCRIVGEGDGGVSGFASGGAAVRLTEEAGQTRLTYGQLSAPSRSPSPSSSSSQRSPCPSPSVSV